LTGERATIPRIPHMGRVSLSDFPGVVKD